MSYQEEKQRDELRARFTKWMETTVYRARIDYIRKNAIRYEIISFEDVPEEMLQAHYEEHFQLEDNKTAFDFEDEWLAKAFYELPLMRQRVLAMLFAEEKKPVEIANILHCTVQNVYNQRSLALKKLRKMLEKGGDKQ